MRKFTVKYKVKPTTILGKILSFIGFIKYEKGYFHQVGYSGKQKNNEPDIAIIEKKNGQVITVPNNCKHYKLISYGI